MNGHRVHAFRILVRCECGTAILWGCSYTRARRNDDGERACVAIDTYQRRHQRRAHRCTIARVPRRRPRTLVEHARNIFGAMLVSPTNVLVDAPTLID